MYFIIRAIELGGELVAELKGLREVEGVLKPVR
jgi:hypothetical protein